MATSQFTFSGISSTEDSITVKKATFTTSAKKCSWRLCLYEDEPISQNDFLYNWIDEGWSSSYTGSFSNRTFNNLDQGTTYYVACYGFINDDWNNIITKVEKITTKADLYSISVAVKDISINSATITVSANKNSKYWDNFRYAIYDSYDDLVYKFPKNENDLTTDEKIEYTIKNLQSGKNYTYICRVAVYNDTNDYIDYIEEEISFTTKQDTKTYLTIKLNGFTIDESNFSSIDNKNIFVMEVPLPGQKLILRN